MKILRIVLSGILLCASTVLLAQEPYKVTEKFFPKPQGIEISTPGCLRASEDLPPAPSFTTYDEMLTIMARCARLQPNWITKETIGTSQNGTPIYAWRISNASEKNEKLRVLYLARVHGNEPSGTEALLFFAQQLCKKSDLQALLKRIDFYLVPMLNVDGAAENKRSLANKMDLNRDQSLVSAPESYAIESYVHRVQPQIAVDFHEYYAANSKYMLLSSDTLSLPWDVMTSCTKNLNVPPAIKILSEEKFITAVEDLANKMSWPHTFYTSSDMEDGKLIFSRGGVSPTTTTAVFPLQNVMSFIVETRRTGPHNRSLERRTWIAYSMALEFSRVAFEQAQEIRTALFEAQQDTQRIVVRFAGQKAEPFEYMFMNTSKVKHESVNVLLRDMRKAQPKLTRSFPKGYYVLPAEEKMKAQLERQNIQFTVLPEAKDEEVEAYQVKRFTPKTSIEVEATKRVCHLPAGTLYISLQQPKARWITLMMEPEAYHSYVVKDFVTVTEGEDLPYYRSVIHTK